LSTSKIPTKIPCMANLCSGSNCIRPGWPHLSPIMCAVMLMYICHSLNNFILTALNRKWGRALPTVGEF
jgi:hypothetical protein